jgi:hypothetical protein
MKTAERDVCSHHPGSSPWGCQVMLTVLQRTNTPVKAFVFKPTNEFIGKFYVDGFNSIHTEA